MCIYIIMHKGMTLRGLGSTDLLSRSPLTLQVIHKLVKLFSKLVLIIGRMIGFM